MTWTNNDTLFDALATAFVAIYQNGVTPNIKQFCAANGANRDVPLGAYAALATVFDGAASSMRLNQGAAATGDVGATTALDGITLGARNDQVNFANVEVRDVIVFPGSHSNAVQLQIQAYLQTVGGL